MTIVLKISNLLNNSKADYKTLKIENIQTGTQVYDFENNLAYVKYNGGYESHMDLAEISESLYLESLDYVQNQNEASYDEKIDIKIKSIKEENELLMQSQLSQDELIMTLMLGEI